MQGAVHLTGNVTWLATVPASAAAPPPLIGERSKNERSLNVPRRRLLEHLAFAASSAFLVIMPSAAVVAHGPSPGSVQLNSFVVLLVVAPRVLVHGGERQCELCLVPSETNSSDISLADPAIRRRISS